jgi:hypothetical protein
MPANKIDSLGMPIFNMSIAFKRFEKMPGNKIDPLGVSSFNVSAVV